MISIKNLDKAKVLKALYDHSHIQGYGFLQTVPDGFVTVEHCRELLSKDTYFDYLYGKVLKVDLSGDAFDERLYDRDCGPGAAARAVNSVHEYRGPTYVRMALDSGIEADVDYDLRELKLRFRTPEEIDKMIYILETHRHRVREGKV